MWRPGPRRSAQAPKRSRHRGQQLGSFGRARRPSRGGGRGHPRLAPPTSAHVTGYSLAERSGANAKTGRADLANDSISLTVFTGVTATVGERTEHVVQTTRPGPCPRRRLRTGGHSFCRRRSRGARLRTAPRRCRRPVSKAGPRSVPDSAVPSFGNRRRDVVRPSGCRRPAAEAATPGVNWRQ